MRTAIDTNRLSLRPFQAQDCARVIELAGAWDVARMVTSIPHPYLPEDFQGWQAGHAQKWADGTDFPFAVTTASDGLIGAVGLHKKEKDFELGYWFGQPFWGMGYATEAGAALAAYGFADLGADAFFAAHFEDNPASGRVLSKLGFAYTGGVRITPCLARGNEVRAPEMHLRRKGGPSHDA